MACDPRELANAARCISSCIPKGEQTAALISLFCQIVENGGGGGGGSGTVTSFSAGDLSPLFTTGVATPTTTPALSFALSTQAANLVFAGPTSGGAAAPTFRALVAADLPAPASGVGTPEGTVTAPVGATYVDLTSTTNPGLWVKAVGSGNTGWRELIVAGP